jgi:hypothetical protein
MLERLTVIASQMGCAALIIGIFTVLDFLREYHGALGPLVTQAWTMLPTEGIPARNASVSLTSAT